MSEGLTVYWFFNRECEYCINLEPEVEKFALSKNATLIKLEHGILDPETNEVSVPALIYSDPRVENRIFVGQFCLDALRYCLKNA